MSEVISFRGDKKIWDKFVSNIKLRKLDIWEMLEPFITSNTVIDYEKVKKFTESALNEYGQSNIIGKLIETREVPSTDGTFFQFPAGGWMDIKFFQEDKGSHAYCPELPGIGSDIAYAERNYLVKQLLGQENKIQSQDVKRSDIDLSKISLEASAVGNQSTILLPNSLMGLSAGRFTHLRINYDHKIPLLDDEYKLEFVPDEVIGNKIIFLQDFSCLWLYTRCNNIITGKPEVLHIEIAHQRKGEKIFVIAKTLAKLKVRDTKHIKILNIVDNKK